MKLIKILFFVLFVTGIKSAYAQEAPSRDVPVKNEPASGEELKPEIDSVPSPVDITPVLEKPSKQNFVPLPPQKPDDLREAADKPVPAEAPELQDPPKGEAAQPDEPLIDPSIPLPPQKPVFDLLIPPSMEMTPPTDKEQDGLDESVAGGIEKQVDTVELACIKPEVMEIVKKTGLFFRAIPIVTSGYRSRGRRGSLHRRCMAVDFIVPGVSKETLTRYLRSLPEAGGVGTYCHTKSVHIDIGEARDWGYCGFRRTYFRLR